MKQNYDYLIEVSVNVKMKVRLDDCSDENARERAEAEALASIDSYPCEIVSKEVVGTDIIISEIATTAA